MADMGTIFSAVMGEDPTTEEASVEEVPAEVEALESEQVEADAVVETDEGEEAEPEATDAPDFELLLRRGDEEYRVSDRAEAVKLAQLGLHFTKNNEEFLAGKREFEAQRQDFERGLMQTRQEYVEALELARQYLTNPVGERPVRAQFSTVQEYDSAVQAWESQAQIAQQIGANIQAEREQLDKDRQAAMQRFVAESENTTLALIPEWADQKVRVDEARQIEEHLVAAGLNPEIMQRYPMLPFEPVFRLMARRSWLYGQAEAAGKTKVAEAATKSAAPGPGAETGRAQDRKQLRETKKRIREGGGKIVDAAPLMEAILSRTTELQRQ